MTSALALARHRLVNERRDGPRWAEAVKGAREWRRKAADRAAGIVELPWACLTCGYGEVPGEDFDAHDCDTFRALPDAERQAHEIRYRAEIKRLLAEPSR